jgi:3-hydroxyisobutyrate dehydrogenase-like beta-hydroxyacid dehydrogenase
MIHRLAFLGFGEAARAFCDSLRQADANLAFEAHDAKLGGAEDATLRAAMAERGVVRRETTAALAGAELILSAVTADQSLIAVEPLLSALRPGQVLVDINSVSPERKRETARRVEAQGAVYVDMAVMAPVHPKGHRTPVLVAGRDLGAVRAFLDAMAFDWREVGDAPGAATAIKMVRSVFVKGLEAITVEALLAAERSGCRDTILASLAGSYPGLGWPENAAYAFERSLRHGVRRAAEMRESAATLEDLGLTSTLASAIAEVQEAQGQAGPAVDLGGTLDELIAQASAARAR